MWEADVLFPVAYFGLSGTCLSCGWRTWTQDLLAPRDPAEYVRQDTLPDRYLSAWKKLMEVKDDAA